MDDPEAAAAPARAGDIAIAEELDAARRDATVAAYDLFLARHPGHALAAVAKEERERLIKADAEKPPPE